MVRLTAEQGHATAQFNLGLVYSEGRGVPQDYREAIRWNRLKPPTRPLRRTKVRRGQSHPVKDHGLARRFSS